MTLFDLDNTGQNLLPRDGALYYYGKVMSQKQANTYFELLFNTIDWKHDEAVVYGKRYVTKRKVAWYGDEPFAYTYSNTTKYALAFTDTLLELKELTQQITKETYNSCLLNLYHSGEEGMAWHSDDEKDLKKNAAIASLSFGAERKFAFKHKTTKEKKEFILEHGSILVMKGNTQTYWLHRLPPTKKISTPRINLTFRTINN